MAKVKAKEHENLSDSNIKKVIELLEAEKPISKKDACEILNISYNPTRLNKIIENYKAEQLEFARRKAANRGKSATPYEIQVSIERFLDGESITEIAKRLYRPSSFVKDIIENIGVPQKPVGATYANIGLIPEQCAREEFRKGQIAWSAKRHCMCIVLDEQKASDKTNKYYQIYVIEPIEEVSPYYPQYQSYGGFYDGAYAYDLGSLDHLKQYGVDVSRQYKPHFKGWIED